MVKVQINPVITLVKVIVYFTMPDLIPHVKCECINAWFTNSIHFAGSTVLLIEHFQIQYKILELGSFDLLVGDNQVQ